MGILKLADEVRSTLYYNKYLFKASFSLMGLGYSRYSEDLSSYKNTIRIVQEQSKKHNVFWETLRTVYREDSYWESIDYDNISKYITWKYQNKDNMTLRLERDKASVFFNDPEILKGLEEIVPSIEVTKIDLKATGTLFFKKEPKHNYRAYFKSAMFKKEYSQDLENFVEIYSANNDIKISKSFTGRTTSHHHFYYNRHGYIDYNDENFLTLLYIHFPDLINKVYKLEKTPT